MSERITILSITLLACAIRLWGLDAKGLAYDEAATALMARAMPWEIVEFHWQASFEHPPAWQLLMHFWSNLAGQSEWALRFVPALAGVSMIPLMWQVARRGRELLTNFDQNAGVAPRLPATTWQHTPGLSSLLLAFSPVLVLYSQEARMYTIVGALALAVLYVAQRLADAPSWRSALKLVLLHWLMLSFHYYSVLLLGVEALYFGLIAWLTPRRWWQLGLSLLLALLPLLAWAYFAPGFRITAAIVLRERANAQPGVLAFLDQLWRDLSFGAIRWQPPTAEWGYGLLPLLVLAAGRVVVRRAQWAPRPRLRLGIAPAHLLLLLTTLLPILLSLLFFRTLATRYILFVLPALYWLIAVSIAEFRRIHWGLGFFGLAVALAVAGSGLYHYFARYQKSEYQQMATFLTPHLRSSDAILLEAPRQHLLAKYYLPPELNFYTAPAVVLPAYWPISAQPVVPEEMDGQLQKYLRQHRTLWLILTAQDEVDKGEFVTKYLRAVSFQTDCQSWLDVILCQFLSPHFVSPTHQIAPQAHWQDELMLQRTTVALSQEPDEVRYLLVTLHWQASRQPTLDYRVTLRLVDQAGNVIQQRDDFPIGDLLPPTTWGAGDEKPGYMALPLPAGLKPGVYEINLGLYDPATVALIPYSQQVAPAPSLLLTVGQVTVADQVTVGE